MRFRKGIRPKYKPCLKRHRFVSAPAPWRDTGPALRSLRRRTELQLYRRPRSARTQLTITNTNNWTSLINNCDIYIHPLKTLKSLDICMLERRVTVNLPVMAFCFDPGFACIAIQTSPLLSRTTGPNGDSASSVVPFFCTLFNKNQIC